MEREQLEIRHAQELQEIQALKDTLVQQKEQLEEQQEKLHTEVKIKKKGLVLNRMQGLTRLAAAKSKAEEHDEKKRQYQREMIINRLKSSSESLNYKTQLAEARRV